MKRKKPTLSIKFTQIAEETAMRLAVCFRSIIPDATGDLLKKIGKN